MTGHGHGHYRAVVGHAGDDDPWTVDEGHGDGFVPGRWARRRIRSEPGGGNRVRGVLAGIVLVIVVGHVAGVAVLWPRGPAPVASRSVNPYEGVAFAQGTVRAVEHKTCQGDSGDRLADGSIPATVTCGSVEVAVEAVPGLVTVGIPPEVDRSGVRVGDQLQLVRYPATAGIPATYAFVDFARGVPLTLLTVAFVLLVLAVARWRGLAALGGLLLAFLAVAVFVLPALRRGESPVLVAAVAAGSVMVVILYLAHGFSTKTTAALLGTLAGVWVSAGLAAWVSVAAHLNGLGSEENAALSRLTTGRDLSGLVLAGIVLAGLGVLNDVTITQASAVWELHEHAPHLSRVGLFASAMRIGRDHLSSTVYTLAFAYAGVALPTLLLQDLYGTPLQQLLTSNQIAEELGRTLVASIGLILAIPLTTAIAVLLAHRRVARPPSPGGGPVAVPTAAVATPGGAMAVTATRTSRRRDLR